MENCSICTEPLVSNVVVTYCDHQFHESCITEWGKIQQSRGLGSSCPMCRSTKVIFDEVRTMKEMRQKYMDTYLAYNKFKESTENLKHKLFSLTVDISFLEQSEAKLKHENEHLLELLKLRVQPGESEYSVDIPIKYQLKPHCCQGIVHDIDKHQGHQCTNKMKFGNYCGRHKRMFSPNFTPTVMKSTLTGKYHVILVDHATGNYKYHCKIHTQVVN